MDLSAAYSTPLHTIKHPITTKSSTTKFTINKIYSYSSPPPSVTTSTTSQPTSLPTRTIPGSYGLPLLGPLADRLDYAWFQGSETFFKKRVEKNKSTVFRTNVPPSFPFFLVNPNVIAVLDVKSFAHMFDMELVDKRNVLVGDWMPSTKFTGDRRVCAYLDPSEPQHEQDIDHVYFKSENRTEWCSGPCYLFARKFTRGASMRLLTNGVVGPYDPNTLFLDRI